MYVQCTRRGYLISLGGRAAMQYNELYFCIAIALCYVTYVMLCMYLMLCYGIAMVLWRPPTRACARWEPLGWRSRGGRREEGGWGGWGFFYFLGGRGEEEYVEGTYVEVNVKRNMYEKE